MSIMVEQRGMPFFSTRIKLRDPLQQGVLSLEQLDPVSGLSDQERFVCLDCATFSFSNSIRQDKRQCL